MGKWAQVSTPRPTLSFILLRRHHGSSQLSVQRPRDSNSAPAHPEMTEFLIVLNSRSALRSFMSAGSLTFGGNLSLAVGPLGRNGEVSGSVNSKGKVAAMYSYSKTKGLFGGISVEGSVILERQDANCAAYKNSNVTAKMLLSGHVPPPPWAMGLIDVLEKSTGGVKGWIQEDVNHDLSPDSYAFGSGIVSPSASSRKSSSSMSTSSFKKPGKKSSGPIIQNNPADMYFGKQKRKDLRNGLGIAEDDWDKDLREHYRSTSPSIDSPFRSTSTFGANDLTIKDDPLISSSIPAQQVSSTPRPAGDTPSRFETYFESDFDPFRDTAKTTQVTHRRNTRSPFSGSNLTRQKSVSTPNSDQNRASFSLYDHPTTHKLATAAYSDLPYDVINSSFNAEPGGLPTPPLTTSPMSSNASSPTSPSAQHVHTPSRSLSLKRGLRDDERDDGFEKAIALFDYTAQEDGDLSFKKGDVITIVKRSESKDDWWTGVANAYPGVFPANYVEVV